MKKQNISQLRTQLGIGGPGYSPMLSGTNHLMMSTDYIPGEGRVIIQNTLVYAPIHNDGVTAKMKGFFWAQHYRARGNMPELEVVDEVYGQLEILQQEQQDTYLLTCPASMITMQSVSGIDNIGNPVNSLCIAKNL